MVIKEQIFDEQVENDEKEGSFMIDHGEERRADEARGQKTSQRDKEMKVKDKEVLMSQGREEDNTVSSPDQVS